MTAPPEDIRAKARTIAEAVRIYRHNASQWEIVRTAAEAFDHWDDEWDDLTPEDASGRNVAARMIAECIRSKDPA